MQPEKKKTGPTPADVEAIKAFNYMFCIWHNTHSLTQGVWLWLKSK